MFSLTSSRGPSRALPSTGDEVATLSRRRRWRRRLLRRSAAALVFLLALALTASRLAPHEVVAVVAAARDLPAGHVVTAADLTTVPVPDTMATLAPARPDDVVGQRLAGPVVRDEPLLASRFVTASADHLPPGTAPVHVIAADPVELDLLHPGGSVAVYVSSGPRQGEANAAGTGDGTDVAARWLAVTGETGAVVLSVDSPTSASVYAPTAATRGAVVALTTSQLRELLAVGEPAQPLVAHLLARPG